MTRPLSIATLALLLSANGARADGFAPRPAPATSGYGHLDRSGYFEHGARGLIEGMIVGNLAGWAIAADAGATEATRSRARLIGYGAGAAGMALPLLINLHGEVRSGDVVLINAAQDWGLAHGLVVPFVVQLGGCGTARRAWDGDCLTRNDLRLNFVLGAAASLGAGLGAALVARRLDVPPGQASAIGSAGLWTAVASTLVWNALKPANQSAVGLQAQLATTLALADASMLAAWYFRDRLDLDRRRVLLIDFGGGVGALGGYVAVKISGKQSSTPAALPVLALIGISAGMLVAYHTTGDTNDFHRSAPEAPVAGGPALLTVRDGRASLGAPTPLIMPSPDGGPGHRTTFSLMDARY